MRLLRLATFNLLNLGLRDGEDTPEARERLPRHLQSLRDTLKRLEADAVAFQEVLDPSLLQPLLEGFGYSHLVVSERASSPLLTGVFSRYPLRDPHQVAAGADLAMADRKAGAEFSFRGSFSRPALRVTWEVPGFPLTLLVVHWKSKLPSPTTARRQGPAEPWAAFGDVAEARFLTEVKRLAQAVELRKVVDGLLAGEPEGRVIVLGDCNDTQESEVLRILMGDARATSSPGLVPYELIPAALAIPADLRYTQLYRGRKELIDHILFSRSLLPHFVDARALNEGLREATDSFGPDLYNQGSDHAPLMATFRI